MCGRACFCRPCKLSSPVEGISFFQWKGLNPEQCLHIRILLLNYIPGPWDFFFFFFWDMIIRRPSWPQTLWLSFLSLPSAGITVLCRHISLQGICSYKLKYSRGVSYWRRFPYLKETRKEGIIRKRREEVLWLFDPIRHALFTFHCVPVKILLLIF